MTEEKQREEPIGSTEEDEAANLKRMEEADNEFWAADAEREDPEDAITRRQREADLMAEEAERKAEDPDKYFPE